MTSRPTIFVSAVSKELKGARQLVSNTLQFLGYEPVWQDIFGTEHGDLRAMLRRQIDGCKGVVQLVGQRYGAEPTTPDEQFGRVSYTQYEALYARQRGKRVWYLMLDESFPPERAEPEAEELRELQAAYRRRLQADSHLFHPLNSLEALEADVLKLRNDLTRLRRGAKLWAAGVAALLVLIAAMGGWLVVQQRRMASQVAMVMQFAEVQARQERAGRSGAAVEAATYAELSKEYGVDQKALREELPRRARELQRSPDVGTFERANAAFVAGDYSEAERLALQAAAEAQRANPPRVSDAIKAFKLAGWVSLKRVEYADALRHLREAEKLTDRQRNPAEWADVQFSIGRMLYEQGNYREAEAVARADVNERLRWSGSETLETLYSRNNLASALERQGRYAEAEKEYREVLAVRERLLGAEVYETLVSRNNLAVVLADSGRLAEAEKENRTVLAAHERLLGPEDPDTLTSRHILGVLLQREGRYAEAEKEQRAVLAVRERVSGPEHPDTLRCRNDLATVLDDLGRYAEAEKEHRAVLAIRERVLGPEHPDTLTSRDNLAYVLEQEGNHAEAEREDRRVLAIQERVLGPEHPDTLGTRQHLALVLLSQGKLAESEEEFRPLLASQEHLYGSEAAETFRTRQRLAYTLYCQGKYAEAITNQQKALAVAQKVAGDDGRRQTAEAWFALSRYELFARDFAGVLAASEAGLALDPAYLSLLAKRAHAYLFLGQIREAEQIYRGHRGEVVDAQSKRSWEQVVLKDFDDLEKAGLTHPEFARLRELLKTEVK
jgi:tetratricopeptide (TPR) repeat protein